MARTETSNTNKNIQIEVPKKSYQVYNILPRENSTNNVFSATDNRSSILTSIYNNTNARRPHQAEEEDKLRHNDQRIMTPNTDEKTFSIYNRISKANTENRGSILISIYNNTNAKRTNSGRAYNTDESFEMGNAWMKPAAHKINNSDRSSTVDSSMSKRSTFQTKKETSDINHQLNNESGGSLSGGLYNFKEWAGGYIFGNGRETSVSHILKTS